jgi:hypothetical protein
MERSQSTHDYNCQDSDSFHSPGPVSELDSQYVEPFVPGPTKLAILVSRLPLWRNWDYYQISLYIREGSRLKRDQANSLFVIEPKVIEALGVGT